MACHASAPEDDGGAGNSRWGNGGREGGEMSRLTSIASRPWYRTWISADVNGGGGGCVGVGYGGGGMLKSMGGILPVNEAGRLG